MTRLLTYHGDPRLKWAVLDQLAAHREADEIAQGAYWDNGKGCAVGCLTHDSSGGHDQYPKRWGIPEWLAYLEDRIFEGLPVEAAVGWPERFMAAIPVGVEIPDTLADELAIQRLDALLDLAPDWPESVRDEVVAAVERMIVALRARIDGDDSLIAPARSAAWSAADSARSAAWSACSAAWSAWSAARSAAGSAAEAAKAAALAARSSARSAADSARSSAWGREADRLIAALSGLELGRTP